MVAIKGEHSKMVGEVHQPIFILVDVPILQSGTGLFKAVILKCGDAVMGTLPQAGSGEGQQKSKGGSYSA